MARLLLRVFFWIIHWAVILPLVLIVATPYILITAFFGESRYDRAVISYYKKICVSFAKFWDEAGFGFTP